MEACFTDKEAQGKDPILTHDELQSSFSNLAVKTYKTLVAEHKFSVAFLRSCFSNFPSTRFHEHQEFLDKYLLSMETEVTAEDLWPQLSSYWSYFSYELLKVVIDRVGHKSLTQIIQQYEADFGRFCKEISLVECSHYDPPLQPSNSEDLLITFQEDQKNAKLAFVKNLEMTFAAAFKLPKICGFFFKCIKDGITAVWSVPSHYHKLLRWKLSICDDEFFEKHMILSVSLNGEVCYSRGSSRTPINPATEVALKMNVTGADFQTQKMISKVMASSPPFTVTDLCTAYILKRISQYLTTLPGYSGKQIRNVDDLPSDVSAHFSALTWEAYWYLTLFDYEGKYDKVNPIGLGSQGVSERVWFIDYTVQEYLAAITVAEGTTVDYSEGLSELQHSLFPFFVAGHAGKEFNLSLFGEFTWWTPSPNFIFFERSSPTLIADALLDNPPEFDSDPYHAERNSFTYGYAVFFCSASIKLTEDIDFGCFCRGALAASELVFDNKYPLDTLKLEMIVYCNSTDLKAFIALPYCFLQRVEKLSLLKHPASIGTKKPSKEYKTILQTEAIFEILAHHSGGLRELTICMFQDPLWDSAVTRGLDQVALKVLKIHGKVTYEYTSGLWNFLKSKPIGLAELEFDSCGLGDRAALEIASMLQASPSLEKLALLNNQGIISSSSVKEIAKNLVANTSLKLLSLQNCKIKGPGVIDLAKMLSCNQILNTLSLRCNLLTDESVAVLSESLISNSTLVELDLSSNMLTEDIALAAILRGNRSLKILNVSENSITNVSAVAESLKVNSVLCKLDIAENELTDQSAKTLADALVANNTLETLDCSRNRLLSYSCVKWFISSLSKNNAIKSVILPQEVKKTSVERIVFA